MRRSGYSNGDHDANDVSHGSESDDYYHGQSDKDTYPPKIAQTKKSRRQNDQQNGRDVNQAQRNRRRYESRYEHDPPNVEERAKRLQAIRIKVFKNADPLYRGLDVSVNKTLFPNVDCLLDFLNKKMDTRDGVRHLFNLRDQRKVTEITNLEMYDMCVVSSVPRYSKETKYGIVNGPSSPLKSSAMVNSHRSSRAWGRSQGGHQSGLSEQNGNHRTPTSNHAKKISFFILSNTNRSKRERMILNPQTNQTFEQFLCDMGDMLPLENPPATGIFSTSNPASPEKIESFSKLFQDVKKTQTYIICGLEKRPHELAAMDSYDGNNGETEEDDLDHDEEEYSPEPERKVRNRKKKPAVKPEKNGFDQSNGRIDYKYKQQQKQGPKGDRNENRNGMRRSVKENGYRSNDSKENRNEEFASRKLERKRKDFNDKQAKDSRDNDGYSTSRKPAPARRDVNEDDYKSRSPRKQTSDRNYDDYDGTHRSRESRDVDNDEDSPRRNNNSNNNGVRKSTESRHIEQEQDSTKRRNNKNEDERDKIVSRKNSKNGEENRQREEAKQRREETPDLQQEGEEDEEEETDDEDYPPPFASRTRKPERIPSPDY